MSQFLSVPSYLQTKTGEVVSRQMLAWINATHKKLKKSFPPGEQAFCRIVDKILSRMPKEWKKRFWYTRQKHYLVAPEIVFFGDFHFGNLHMLVEIDGSSHTGPIAQENDLWRSRMIELWKVKVARITNSQVVDGDFRGVEQWLLDQAASVLPWSVRRKMFADYNRMMMNHQHIYAVEGVVSTYR